MFAWSSVARSFPSRACRQACGIAFATLRSNPTGSRRIRQNLSLSEGLPDGAVLQRCLSFGESWEFPLPLGSDSARCRASSWRPIQVYEAVPRWIRQRRVLLADLVAQSCLTGLRPLATRRVEHREIWYSRGALPCSPLGGVCRSWFLSRLRTPAAAPVGVPGVASAAVAGAHAGTGLGSSWPDDVASAAALMQAQE